ncbi:hypothetical protein SAMN02745216_03906 [Desulfatibacillum alkenivorans DSM 16219]|jgi:hypothetical protein|uniref:Uncharacterized protein n=1 Tax=Desulfatibacillum alkenivorans DSM 16219 TaxID=1121393 RepID=A0A1M6UHA5_9BACT|nr:hypothetical protein [Desulfatibacillum alkenivorans]SHK68549.1 hypothetical protein SAMN02745216_03906 [Desulfatibacillum alkenivorans DSM 16219]
MQTFVWMLVIGCSIFVYWDATRNKIGKISDKKSLTNAPAGLWAFGTFMLWIMVFPLYLYKRKDLIAKAKEHPVEPSQAQRKAILSVLGVLLVLALISGFFGDSKAISIVKNGELQDCPGIAFGKVIDQEMDNVQWREDDDGNGITLVSVSGTMEGLNGDDFLFLTYRVINETGRFQLQQAMVNGQYVSVSKMEQHWLSRCQHLLPKDKRPETEVSTDEANAMALTDLESAYTAAAACFVDKYPVTVNMTELKNYGFVGSKGVTVEVLNGEAESLRLRAYHINGDTIYEVGEPGEVFSYPR